MTICSATVVFLHSGKILASSQTLLGEGEVCEGYDVWRSIAKALSEDNPVQSGHADGHPMGCNDIMCGKNEL